MPAVGKLELPKRLSWSRLPTPIQKLTRVSLELGANVYVKRDDLTGFVTGGNKIRKLDFLYREALDQGATAVISCGGVQSNHCRAVAAVAAQYGLECILILRGERPAKLKANLLLDYLLGAKVLYVTDEEYEHREELRMRLEEQIRGMGGKGYYIPEGGSNPLGTMGYVEAWREIQSQLGTREENLGHEIPKHFDSVVFATGSGGTQCGLLLGRLLTENAEPGKAGEVRPAPTKIIGANVCYDKQETFRIVKDLLWKTLVNRNVHYSFLGSDIELLDGFIGKGYAQNTPEELRFFAKIAKLEGMVLDPTYSGKAFLGLYETLKRDKTAFGENVLFIHTGGAFGNFKYSEEWNDVV